MNDIAGRVAQLDPFAIKAVMSESAARRASTTAWRALFGPPNSRRQSAIR